MCTHHLPKAVTVKRKAEEASCFITSNISHHLSTLTVHSETSCQHHFLAPVFKVGVNLLSYNLHFMVLFLFNVESFKCHTLSATLYDLQYVIGIDYCYEMFARMIAVYKKQKIKE